MEFNKKVSENIIGFILMRALSLKLSCVLTITLSGLMIGCGNNDVDGNVNVVNVTPQFVVKAKTGDDRYIITDQRNSLFYQLYIENYLGQFPINYQPKKYPPLSETEVINLERVEGYSNWLSFYLTLNGATQFKPTNKYIYNGNSLDDIDQVKVEIFEEPKIKDSNYFLKNLSNFEHDQESSKKYNMDCYTVISNNTPFPSCFSRSDTKGVPDAFFLDMNAQTIKINSYVPELGIRTSLVFDKSHLQDWREIQFNVWRIINTWNVSPTRQ